MRQLMREQRISNQRAGTILTRPEGYFIANRERARIQSAGQLGSPGIGMDADAGEVVTECVFHSPPHARLQRASAYQLCPYVIGVVRLSGLSKFARSIPLSLSED